MYYFSFFIGLLLVHFLAWYWFIIFHWTVMYSSFFTGLYWFIIFYWLLYMSNFFTVTGLHFPLVFIFRLPLLVLHFHWLSLAWTIFIFHCPVLVGIISKFFAGLYSSFFTVLCIMSIEDFFVFHWPISFSLAYISRTDFVCFCFVLNGLFKLGRCVFIWRACVKPRRKPFLIFHGPVLQTARSKCVTFPLRKCQRRKKNAR